MAARIIYANTEKIQFPNIFETTERNQNKDWIGGGSYSYCKSWKMEDRSGENM